MTFSVEVVRLNKGGLKLCLNRLTGRRKPVKEDGSTACEDRKTVTLLLGPTTSLEASVFIKSKLTANY